MTINFPKIISIFSGYFLALTIWTISSTLTYALGTPAKSALVFDHETSEMILEKNPDIPIPPASMSKLMTLNMLFEALRQGQITLEDEFLVSRKASKKGGSKMFLREGEKVTIKDLILGIIVLSGNDACIVAAEGLAGTEEEFSKRMTRRGKQLGLKNSTFKNSTGWPDPDHKMSARDLITLAIRIQTEFPEYYKYFAIKEFTWDNITQKNRNPLLNSDIKADGLKTGYTKEAGYGFVGAVEENGRRVTFILTGLSSVKQRFKEADKMAKWALRDFNIFTLANAGDVFINLPVWIGSENSVNLEVSEPIKVLAPAYSQSRFNAMIVTKSPLSAPIKKGEVLGELIIDVPRSDDINQFKKVSFPLVASQEIASGGIISRSKAALTKIYSFLFGMDN